MLNVSVAPEQLWIVVDVLVEVVLVEVVVEVDEVEVVEVEDVGLVVLVEVEEVDDVEVTVEVDVEVDVVVDVDVVVLVVGLVNMIVSSFERSVPKFAYTYAVPADDEVMWLYAVPFVPVDVSIGVIVTGRPLGCEDKRVKFTVASGSE